MSSGDAGIIDGAAERELRIAKLALLARRAGVNAGATALNSLLIAALLYRSVPRARLATWVILSLAGAAWTYQRSARRRRPPRGTERGLRMATVSCAAAGLLQGSVVLLLYDATDLVRFLVLLTLGAMATSASVTLAPVPSAAQGYISGALVLPAAIWLYRGRLEYAVLAGLSLSMAFFLMRHARAMHEIFLEGIVQNRRLSELRERFLRERDEWLDLSRAAEAFALLDEAGRMLLWNAHFEQLVQPQAVERGASYLGLLEGSAHKPSSIDGEAVTPEQWLLRRAELLEREGEQLEAHAGDVFRRVSSHRVKSGRQVVLTVNVSALKLAERHLHEREMTLLRAQRQESVGVLAGGVAHDFNNLLTAVGGAAELLSYSVTAEEDRRLIDDIKAGVDRGARLTRQLLAYGRRQAQNRRALSFNDLVERGLPLFRRLLPATIALRTELDPKLSQVNADPEQIDQVLVNLVLNARDAMPTGGELVLSTQDQDAFVELCVTDTGTGMSPEIREHIFEPFFSTKEQQYGSGLGLCAVQGIVRQSGGTISVRTAPGEGTRMIIQLPRCELPASPSAQSRPARESHVGRSACVLLVDDEQAVLEVTARLLERLGHRVLQARGAGAALELIEVHAGSISLLVTDVVMPAMNGAELAEKARARLPGLAVLFMSGYEPGLLEKFETREVLHKPFSPAELAEAVARALSEAPSFPVGRPGLGRPPSSAPSA